MALLPKRPAVVPGFAMVDPKRAFEVVAVLTPKEKADVAGLVPKSPWRRSSGGR